MQAFGPVQQFRITGIAEFTGVSSVGGATFALFDRPTAQKLFGKVGQLDLIRVQSKAGVNTSTLVSEIKPLLPATATVRDAAAQAKQDKKQVGSFISFIQYALLAFAGVALFVGAFVIANTLSITIAQRMREFATLRTLGASRRQVLWAVVIEAFVIGLLGSVVGLFLGLGLAKLLNALFVAIGIDLPQGNTIVRDADHRRLAASSALSITLVASIQSCPAGHPGAADRRGSRGLRSPCHPVRQVRAGAPRLGAAASIADRARRARARSRSGIGTAPRLIMLGVGVLLLFFGVSMNAARVVRPLAAALGAPARALGGAPGILARDNATRNPARTASTASALMIGLALVTFVAIFGAGLFKSFEDAVNKIFVADYAVTSTNTFAPIDVDAGKSLLRTAGRLRRRHTDPRRARPLPR